ncbi:hypothetical protein [Salinispora pacifica]|uniref:hypothetical protein n=1 Tax=Salinispora pacifica TaxID=351187 RepID=UPI00039E41C2|nr:hypothetical protein [Salinispora pacifica]
MSLGIFGLLLVGALFALCWRASGRLIATAVAAVLLGVVLAGSNGPAADVSQSVVAGLRSGLDQVGSAVFGGAE